MPTDPAAAIASVSARGAPSMRWRMALMAAGMALLAILVHAGSLLLAFEEREEDFIDETVNQQLLHSMAVWQRTGQLAAPNTPDMRLYHLTAGHAADSADSGDSAESTLPAHLVRLAVGNHEVYVDGREYHVAVREAGNDRFVLEYDVEEHETRLDAQALIISIGALLVGGVTLLGVYLLSGAINRQLAELAEQVNAGAGGSHVRPGMARELLVVAHALDRYSARQAGQLARERDFSANLSHELRTPLAGIRSDAELLAANASEDGVQARRATRIVATVDQVAALADSLLALARDQLPGEMAPVALAALVRETAESLLAAHAAGALRPHPPTLAIDIAASAVVDAHPDLLALVVRNLIDNALRHTPAGTIHIRLQDTVLSVHDGGPGFAAAILPHVFDRYFHAGSAGRSGIGLALVSHVAQVYGWQVAADNHAAGGGLIRLDFNRALAVDPRA